MVVTDLYKPEYLKLNYSELLQKASEITLNVSAEEAAAVAEKTRDQAASRVWFRMRAGRIIMASWFKFVCRTNPSSPSLSLTISIYLENIRFCTTATLWGCEHESVASIS